MSVLEATAFNPLADEEFDYVIVATGPGKGRAETCEGLGIISIGTRAQIIEGKVMNVRTRMHQHYPNAREIQIGGRLRTVAKKERAPLPPLMFPALPMRPHAFQPKPNEMTERERLERYGDPWDEVHPDCKPLLTRDIDSRFKSPYAFPHLRGGR